MFRMREFDNSKLKPTILKIDGKKATVSRVKNLNDVEKVVVVLHSCDPFYVAGLLDLLAQEAYAHNWRFVSKDAKKLPNTHQTRTFLEYAYDNGSLCFISRIMKIKRIMEVQVIKSTKGGR